MKGLLALASAAADAVTLKLAAGEPLTLGFRAASKIYVDEIG